jgi:RNA polymerase sigma-70 factor (ECF subfamily)
MEDPEPNTIPPPPNLEAIYHDYAPRVFHLARRMLGNDADAEDVTQDVLLQVLRKISTFRGEASLPTWLHKVTVNAALAHRRKRAARENHRIYDPLDDLPADGHPGPVRRWSRAAEKQVLDHETQQVIEAAIGRVPEPYRDVYVLADVEGLSNADIAEMLGISLSAVKSRLHRARLMMRDRLAPYFEEVPA